MTDNHGLNTPQKGTSDWHIPLNENFEAIDTGIEVRDVSGARGNYVPKAGAKFFATDTGVEYIGNGNDWKRVDSSGESPSFQSVTSDEVNTVQVANADRTIQEAHDALPGEGGKIWVSNDYVPEGGLPITLSKPVIVEGDGWGGFGDRLDFSDNSTDTIFKVDQGFTQPRLTCSFKHLHVTGGDKTLVIGPGGMVDIYKCWFDAPSTNCVQFSPDGGGLYTRFYHSFFEDAGETGVDMTPPPNGERPNASSFYGCLFNGNRKHGLHARGVGVNVRDCSIEGNGSAGLIVGTNDVATSVNVSGCYFENNGRDESGGDFDADVVIQDGGVNSSTVFNTWHSTGGSPAAYGVHVFSGHQDFVHMIRGPNANVKVSRGTSDAYVGVIDPGATISVESGAQRPRINGLGRASGGSETPDASKWQVGDVVEWTDTNDGSGDGLYMLGHDGSWHSV